MLSFLAFFTPDFRRYLLHGIYWRSTLLSWAQRIVAVHHTFLEVVLRASVILPASQGSAAPDHRCRLPRLFRTDHLIMRRVGLFLGVETGRRLRNAREFAEALEALAVVED